MRIELETNLTREMLNRFYLFTAMSRKILWAVLAVLTVAVIALFTVLTVLAGFYFEMLMYLLIVIVYDLLLIYIHFIAPRIKKVTLYNNSYVFTDENVTVNSVGEGLTDNFTCSYEKFHRCKLNITEMYLYINKNYAYIVDTTSLSQEQIEFICGKINTKKKKK